MAERKNKHSIVFVRRGMTRIVDISPLQRVTFFTGVLRQSDPNCIARNALRTAALKFRQRSVTALVLGFTSAVQPA